MRVGRFGPFEVNLTTGELRKHGIRLKVQDQPFQILALLLARPEALVTREEICQRLWPSGTFVDFDNGLNTALSRLREALGDSAESPRYIETLARRGYRWIVPVDWSTSHSAELAASGSVDAASELEVSLPVPPDFDRPGSWSTRAKFIYGFLLAVALLALGLGWFWIRGQRGVRKLVLAERQITHNLADNPIMSSEISPDGKYVAYVDEIGLHLVTIESGESHDIALPEELRTNLRGVTWFPDGEKLIIDAFSVFERHVLWLISILGGEPRKLRSNTMGAKVSPDGSSIAFIDERQHELWVAGADGGNARRILSVGSAELVSLAWSPAGQRLAYSKRGQREGLSIETISLDGGSPSVVVSDPQLHYKGDLVWLRDGRVVFQMWEGSTTHDNLWEIMTDLSTGLPAGKPAKMTNWFGTRVQGLTASRDGRFLLVTKNHRWCDVHVGDLKENGTRLDSPKRLTSSDSCDFPVAWTRDSGTILFESDRMGGRDQIFKQRLEVGTAEPLVTGSDDQGLAEFSADAAWILYWSTTVWGKSQPARRRLMRFPVSGGSPEQVLELPAESSMGFSCPSRPSSSCVIDRWDQGQDIFYTLDPFQGQGKEVSRTKLENADDEDWSVSPDGYQIAISSPSQLRNQVRILDWRNSTERNLQLPKAWTIGRLCWAADGNTLFAGVSSTEQFLAQIDLNGKTSILLDRNNARLVGSNPRSSPDGRHLAYAQSISQNNVWLVENF